MEIGSTIGHYTILRKLGTGGMGEVFLAEDTTLGRQVALKMVRRDVAADPARRARFEAEARVVAALNHPNIVTVHSIERDGDAHFITMEYVAGKPLSVSIPREGLPPAQLLGLALPLVEAVAAAHERGITHRDLKPDNVMVSADGRVTVLDFGLAKLKPSLDDSADTTLAHDHALTGAGQVLGTIAYMSPEQAEGRPLDFRSDIFSLGIMLFEMATGRRPFAGDSAASIVSSILRDDPVPATRLNPALPSGIERAIQRSLEKEPSRRYQSALDLRNDLAEVKRALESGVAPAGAARGGRRPWIYAAAAAAVTVVAAAALVSNAWRADGDETSVGTGNATFTQLTHGAGPELFPTLTPDGRTIAYASGASGNMDIYAQRVGGQNAINLTEGTTADDTQPAYSPDGERIAFRSERDGGGLFIMGATGEAVRRVTRDGYHPAWSPDGAQLLYVTQNITDPSLRFTTSQLWVAATATGEARLVTGGDASQPAWSPDGTRIAYWGRSNGTADIWTMPAAGGTPVAVTTEPSLDWNPVWAPDGRSLYFASDRGGSMNLWRVPIDPETGAATGRAVPVTTGGGAASQHIAISKDGRRIAYVARVESMNVQRVEFDPASGSVRGIPSWITRGSRTVAQPDSSPDGRHIAFNSTGPQEDIFVTSDGGSALQQLTDDPFEDRAARWSPDGARVAFYSNRTGKYEIWTVNRDGSGLRQLTQSPGAHYPVWSPDGRRMAYSTHAPNGAWIFDLDKPWGGQQRYEVPGLADTTQTFEIWSWSPDGRRLAGQKHLTDLSHAGIAIHTIGTRQVQWLTDFGEWPVWLADGRRLIFSHRGALHLVDSATGATREIFSLPQTSLGSVGLSADNRAIYFTLRSAEADVWLLEIK